MSTYDISKNQNSGSPNFYQPFVVRMYIDASAQNAAQNDIWRGPEIEEGMVCIRCNYRTITDGTNDITADIGWADEADAIVDGQTIDVTSKAPDGATLTLAHHKMVPASSSSYPKRYLEVKSMGATTISDGAFEIIAVFVKSCELAR